MAGKKGCGRKPVNATWATGRDIAGQRFGRLVAVDFSHRDEKDQFWLCQCDCGNAKISKKDRLTKGTETSCGCLHRFMQHGLSKKPECAIFLGMRDRCNNPRNQSYRYYGGRGIKVEYANLVEFLADVGDRPTKAHSIDRIDVNKNYAVGNCKWSTKSEQANNCRSNVAIHAFGRTQNLAAWAREFGIDDAIIRGRLKRGFSAEAAIVTPLRRSARRPRKD